MDLSVSNSEIPLHQSETRLQYVDSTLPSSCRLAGHHQSTTIHYWFDSNFDSGYYCHCDYGSHHYGKKKLFHAALNCEDYLNFAYSLTDKSLRLHLPNKPKTAYLAHFLR